MNRVIEIENGKAEFYSGNYSFYAVEKERRYQERMKQYEKEQAKIAQLEKSAEQLRMWAFQGMDKTYRRAISMERRIERMRTTAKPTKARKMDARFTAAEFHGDEVLGIRSLSKSFGEKKLFEGISLKVEGGERIALIGDNGTGKSTLLSLISGVYSPDSGSITDENGKALEVGELRGEVSLQEQDGGIFSATVAENLFLPDERLDEAAELLKELGFEKPLDYEVTESGGNLSPGEKKKIMLARALLDKSPVLALDEPLNHLDADGTKVLISKLKKEIRPVILVSHNDTIGADFLPVNI